MLYFSLFLAGFTLGVFTALKVFAPETQEESWDPQNFPVPEISAPNVDVTDVSTVVKPAASS